MFNFSLGNSTTNGNNANPTPSWMSNNNSNMTGSLFNNNTKTTTSFPLNSSNTLGSGFPSSNGFTFPSSSANNSSATGSTTMVGNGMFSSNSFSNNKPSTTSSSFASSLNPFTTSGSTMTGTSTTANNSAFPSSFSFANNNNNNTTTSVGFASNNKPTFPSFVPTSYTNNNKETVLYYSLTMMDHYKNKSFEECRFDYWNAQKNGIAPTTSSVPTITSTTLGSGNNNNWMTNTANNNSGSSNFGTSGNNPWSLSSTSTNNNTSSNVGTGSLFNFSSGNNPTSNALASGNNNSSMSGNMFNFNNSNSTSTGSNMFSNNNTNNGSSFITNSNTTGSMFNNNLPASNSAINFGSTTNNTSSNNNSAFSFSNSAITNQPSTMFNAPSSNMFNTSTNTNPPQNNFTLNQPSQPFSWNNSSTSNPTTTNPLNSFQTTSTNSINTGFPSNNPSNFMSGMSVVNGAINMDVALLSALNQPYGENALYEEKYQPSIFSNFEEPTLEDNTSARETSLPTFSARPRLGKFKKTTLVEKLNFINSQSQVEDKQPESLFDDLAFRQKNSLKELTIFPNNAFKKTEKPSIDSTSTNNNTVSYEQVKSSTPIVKTTSHPQQHRRASPPSNADLIKPRPIKGMIFHDEPSSGNEGAVTIPKYLPKLTKEGYYTVPSMKELSMMSCADLKLIRNFSIGRVGYGEIQVLGSLDLTRGLDLDRIILEIEKNHVELYSNINYAPNEKPPIGSELNRPCIVTLYNVHPNKSSQGKSVSDTQFQARLKKANQKSGSEFINYSNGEWMFKVNHF